MYLVLLKINKKIYFEDLEDQNEMIDFIDSIENKFGVVEYDKSVIISGDSSDIRSIVSMIEEHYYLHIVGHKIDEKVYKDLLTLIQDLTLDVKITFGIEFESDTESKKTTKSPRKTEIETTFIQPIAPPTKTLAPIKALPPTQLETIKKVEEDTYTDFNEITYSVYINWTTSSVTISLEEVDGEFDTSKSFKQSFQNFDEAMSLFEGLKHDFMEIIIDETESMFSINTHLELVQRFIEHKITLMEWKETQAIKYNNGRYKQKKVEAIDDENTNPDYLTAKEVMKKLRISDQTLANWRRNNLIDFRKISNRKYLYIIESVNEIFENGIDTSGVGNIIEEPKIVSAQIRKINYEEEILNMLKPIALKIPEYRYKSQNFFLNFGNIGLSSSPQVMINNDFQLVDFIRKSVIKETPKDLYEYLIGVFGEGKEPRVDTSKKIQPEFSKFYLNKLFDKNRISK